MKTEKFWFPIIRMERREAYDKKKETNLLYDLNFSPSCTKLTRCINIDFVTFQK